MKYAKDKSQMLVLRMDPELRQRLESAAAFEGVSLSEMVRIILRKIPIIGKISQEDAVKLIHLDGDVEIVGDDKGRE